MACILVVASSCLASGSDLQGSLRDNLMVHVQFLSQPQLEGRRTGTAGAHQARRYIGDQFRQYRLRPWAEAKRYELNFRLGKNVVGIIPGGDSGAGEEIVLVSAHYDHLGKVKGKICSGAADNASGVAVLLEAARRFAAGERPKRTIAFAAFDAEEQMLLGSFAFRCRDDVRNARIVAVVNVDMLGRDFMDTITNTVFVAGTENYPAIQGAVDEFGERAQLRVLPIGSDLIGPRSDHAAFESRDIPCLFFSCGTFKDYHQPGDTPGRLNSVNLGRSAEIILETVGMLANAESLPSARSPGVNAGELRSMGLVISELCREPAKAGIQTNDLPAVLRLNAQIEELTERGGYDSRSREKLILEAARSLGRYFLPFGQEGSAGPDLGSWSVVMPYLAHTYTRYRRELLEGQYQLIRQILEHPPGLFRALPPFRFEVYELAPEDISVIPIGTNLVALHALGNSFVLSASGKPLIWPFPAFRASFSGIIETLDCEGTREELMDYCLLHFRAGRTNRLHTIALRRVMGAITGRELTGDYSSLLQGRLTEARYVDENEWLLSCMASGNPDLAIKALTAARESKDPRVISAACGIIGDHGARSDVRAQAMQLALTRPDRSTLLALAEVVDDQNPVYRREFCPQLRPGYPLEDRMMFQVLRPLLEMTMTQPVDCIGLASWEGLKRATHRKFGRNPHKWRAFLQQAN
jgi:hypothetical protein